MATALEQVLATARRGIVLSDPQGVVLYANNAIERQSGFSVNEVVGRTPGKLWGGQMSRLFYDTLWTTIEEKKEPFVAEVTNVRKDKVHYPELLAIAPIGTKDDKSEYFVALQMGSIVDTAEREHFRQSFSFVFAQKHHVSDEERLRYMISELGARYAIPATGKVLSEVFREMLVEPFQERFRKRAEDRTLILAAQSDGEDFHALYAKYRRSIEAYFLKHLKWNRDTVEDLTQDTFYRAFRQFKSFRLTNASYGTYLTRVAHNVLVNHFRKQQFFSLMEELSEDERFENTDSGRFTEAMLWQAPSLFETERTILAMKYREGFSVREIAHALNKSENAVKLHLSRARKKLRALLAP